MLLVLIIFIAIISFFGLIFLIFYKYKKLKEQEEGISRYKEFPHEADIERSDFTKYNITLEDKLRILLYKILERPLLTIFFTVIVIFVIIVIVELFAPVSFRMKLDIIRAFFFEERWSNFHLLIFSLLSMYIGYYMVRNSLANKMIILTKPIVVVDLTTERPGPAGDGKCYDITIAYNSVLLNWISREYIEAPYRMYEKRLHSERATLYIPEGLEKFIHIISLPAINVKILYGPIKLVKVFSPFADFMLIIDPTKLTYDEAKILAEYLDFLESRLRRFQELVLTLQAEMDSLVASADKRLKAMVEPIKNIVKEMNEALAVGPAVETIKTIKEFLKAERSRKKEEEEE